MKPVYSKRDGFVMKKQKTDLKQKLLKYYDVIGNKAPLDTTGSIASKMCDPNSGCLNAVPQVGGQDGDNRRDGRKIIIKSIHIEGLVKWQGLVAQTDFDQAGVAIWLVIDTQTNGNQCLSQEVLENKTLTLEMNPCAIRNMEYSDRFRILKKWYLSRPTATSITTLFEGSTTAWHYSGAYEKWETYMNVEIPVNFNTNTAENINAIVDNSLHIIATPQSDTEDVELRYNCRIRYYD